MADTDQEPTLLPMFPLGSVLFPTMVLPLHVFEPRYRALATDVLAGEREFGVTLIERGSEVGGGDVRTGVGCVAQVLEDHTFEDGRMALGCVGTRRIVVTEWLDDDPYPRALVLPWADEVSDEDLQDQRDSAEAALRKVFGIYAQMGANVDPEGLDLAAEPLMASYQISALAPLGPLDRHRLLAAETLADRLDMLVQMLTDEAELAPLRGRGL